MERILGEDSFRDSAAFGKLVSEVEKRGKIPALSTFLAYRYDGHPTVEETEVLRLVSEGFDLCTKEEKRERETIAEALRAVSPDDSGTDYRPAKAVQNLEVIIGGGEKRAYFIADDKLSFRHQGDKNKKPSRVFLRDLTRYSEEILVYYAASGSGKTVELAGSSVTRQAHLTFVISDVKDPEASLFETQFLEQAKELLAQVQEDDRELQRLVIRFAADAAVMPRLRELVEKARTQLQHLVDAARAHKEPLRIVVAVDEGSSCTRLVRGMLCFKELMTELVKDAFVDADLSGVDEIKLHVQTSFAGTGLASATMGSNSRNFMIVQPYHELDGKNHVYDHDLGLLNKKLLVPWSADFQQIKSFDVIQDHLPVVATLMQNGRMASIAISELGKYNDCDPVHEPILVDRIVESFMKSNGMSSLVGREMTRKRQSVAAAALAVHLFRKMECYELTVPSTSIEVSNFARKMLFFPLASETETSVLELVATFGLLEPWDSGASIGQSICPPLQMSMAQQLVAAHMLGIGLESMLDPSWIGFEIMSTHFVNCAIAASVAVLKEKRPTLEEALSCLGFEIDDKATSDDVKQTWVQMKHWKAVAASPRTEDEETLLHSKTRQIQAGLEIDETTGLLVVDKMLHKSIVSLSPTAREFAPPVACINHGNSEFPDGFVTFYAVENDCDDQQAQKWTVMIQAKDYHGVNNSIDAMKLNCHAEKTEQEALDGVFGENRLLCVASSHPSLVTTRSPSQKQKFLPFAFQKGYLLSALLKVLKERRCKKSRRETFAFLCDENGEVVDAESVPGSAKKPRTGA